MRIIIEGERAEGKSTLALILQYFMRRALGFAVDRVEENLPRQQEQLLNKEEVIMSRERRGLPFDIEPQRLRPRRVEIIVRNPEERKG